MTTHTLADAASSSSFDAPTAAHSSGFQGEMTASVSLHTPHEHQPFIDEEGTPDDHTRAGRMPQIDVNNHRYPFCLVWGPLPLISWIFPWIGHLGIGDSEGKVHDFAGPYFIGIDNFMTPIFKYVQIDREVWAGKEAAWDIGVLQADSEYRKTMHNICGNNCHHHTARALSVMKLGNGALSGTSMLSAWWLVTRKGQFVSTGAWLCTYMPLMCGLALMLALILWAKV